MELVRCLFYLKPPHPLKLCSPISQECTGYVVTVKWKIESLFIQAMAEPVVDCQL